MRLVAAALWLALAAPRASRLPEDHQARLYRDSLACEPEPPGDKRKRIVLIGRCLDTTLLSTPGCSSFVTPRARFTGAFFACGSRFTAQAHRAELHAQDARRLGRLQARIPLELAAVGGVLLVRGTMRARRTA